MVAYLKKPFSHNPLIARKPLIRVKDVPRTPATSQERPCVRHISQAVQTVRPFKQRRVRASGCAMVLLRPPYAGQKRAARWLVRRLESLGYEVVVMPKAA